MTVFGKDRDNLENELEEITDDGDSASYDIDLGVKSSNNDQSSQAKKVITTDAAELQSKLENYKSMMNKIQMKDNKT